MSDFKEKNVISFNNSNFFPPVFTPGVGQKEMVDDHGLKNSTQYLSNIGVSDPRTLEKIYEQFPPEMIDEMILTIRKHKSDITDQELAITILSHL